MGGREVEGDVSPGAPQSTPSRPISSAQPQIVETVADVEEHEGSVSLMGEEEDYKGADEIATLRMDQQPPHESSGSCAVAEVGLIGGKGGGLKRETPLNTNYGAGREGWGEGGIQW